MQGVVITTGANMFFGHTATLVAHAGSVSHAQKDMFQIGNFLIAVTVILAVIMTIFRVWHDVYVTRVWNIADALNILQFVLVLLVASIPVAMPTVFSITLALGALNLSKEKAIVSKLSAIEEMAGVDVLYSDKIGILTKNQLALKDPILFDCDNAQDCIMAGAPASKIEDKDPIDTAVINALDNSQVLSSWKLEKFIPFDPVTKRTEAHLVHEDGHRMYVSKGAPQVIAELAHPSDEVMNRVGATVSSLASEDYRALGVACSDDDGQTWKLSGILPMFDPPRDDSANTIAETNKNSVSVKMITGDDTAIAIETARQLDMGTNILNASDVFPKDINPNNLPDDIVDVIERADGFAQVFPEHKYAIVKALQKRGHLVAMTGDGVNDAPALKQVDCGTAVTGATDTAHEVLRTDSHRSRTICYHDSYPWKHEGFFERITSYTIYRIALTMTIMFLVVLSSIFLNFQPLMTIMIVVMSLLDDITIMSIVYNNTAVSQDPIRWKMSKLLGISTILGFFSVVQSVFLLIFGYHAVMHHDFLWMGLANTAQLQTVMFLQLVASGHLLLFVTRSYKCFSKNRSQ